MIDSDNFYEMLENIQHGVDIKLAMKAFGISKSNLEPWHKKEMVKAKAQANISMQKVIYEHGTEDWRALQWIIERNNKDKENEQQLEAAINKQIAREVAKGLIESGVTGETTGTGGDQGVSENKPEDSYYPEEPKGILRLPGNKINPAANGDI